MRNNINILGVARRLAVAGLLLFAVFGSAWAQGNDGQYVIKKAIYKKVVDNPGPPEIYHYEDYGSGHHYLAHVREGDDYQLQDATEFSPNCLWYSGRETNLSGTNHNYYFVDHNGDFRFLSAPLSSNGTLSLSDSKPPVYLLNNTDQSYYFYDWDYDNWPEGAGVARGHQHNGVTQTTCDFDWEDGQCWEVYWVESKELTTGNFIWELSQDHQYGITDNSGRFRLVTDTPTAMQVTTTDGGLAVLGDIVLETVGSSSSPTATFNVVPFYYIPAYHKYDFNDVKRPEDNNSTPASTLELVHHTYYYCYGNTTTTVPTATQSSGSVPAQWTYNWSLSGEGAEYLSFSNEGTTYVHTSSSSAPTLYYRTANNTGHKIATLTLTVIYDQYGSSQTKSCTVTVKTPCQNPSFSANVTYEGVIVSWTPTAESYTVSWRKNDGGTVGEWSTHDVNSGDITSYRITGLEYNTTYDYKVKATSCTTDDPDPFQFKTLKQPTALVGGAVFGGGRMANVNGKTEVIIINTDSIKAVYGGNDIAGSVLDAAGSTIKLGVTAADPDAVTYNNSASSTKVRVRDVYGGGNGFYLYDDEASGFVGATTPSVTVHNNHSVTDLAGNIVWKNETGADYALTIPTIVKTDITVNTNAVKVDSIFGGAKNAFITNDDDDANGTSITVNGGTIFAVFGGNNYGGNQTAGKHYIEINRTKTGATSSGLGRSFGIGYVFGGGNKVEALKTEVVINGGQCDTVFAGGNAADVANVAEAAKVTVNCVGSAKTITSATITWDGNNISAVGSYDWDGTGIYNVRALFGGNNRADMRGLPTITLTAGGVGTVYGGGNSGKMLAQTPEAADNPIATVFGPNYVGSTPLPIYYSTHVKMSSANILVDYLYGGCQMSDVEYSTWVEIEGGHVGSVYGGCNIGGDVGSTRIYSGDNLTNEEKQATRGATYVKASGGTIYGNLFAGANGFYHCNDGVYYIEGHNFTPGHSYIGLKIPSHNETHVKVSGDVIVNGNVYAGGNMACVGFINATTDNRNFPTFRGLCSVRMDGGTVVGSVYGGGCRASVFGSNEVKVSGGSIGYDGDTPNGGALYGGNDRSGQVAQITNRVFPSANNYDVASDGETSLTLLGVKTYVGITGKPKVGTVYGGGNGDYQPYDPDEYCDITDQPVQSNTFVDINIDADGGSTSGGYINTVYGGGNGVTVLDRITVFVNVQNAAGNAYDQIGTLFGGNNKGDLDILSNVFLLHGQVHTVYGGCNSGHMTGSFTTNGYDNVGSMVHVPIEYRPNGGDPINPVPDATVTGYIYGGCKSAGVTNNTLVLVEGGTHTATLFGGSDISGNIGGTSQVVVTGGTVGNVYGGGNGDYDYTSVPYSGLNPPYSYNSRIGLSGGTAANLFAGGFAGLSGSTYIQMDGGTVTGKIFGGGNQAGTTTAEIISGNAGDGNSNVTITGGFVGTGVYGGCNETGDIEGDVEISLTGGTIGTTNTPANIHGGGYGAPTTVVGDVSITFGVDVDGSHNENLNLYGNLYGGSAFGSVNTDEMNTTTIHINNGTINGNVYGGGLGDADDSDKGWTYGVVHVFVGGEANGSYFGKAAFNGCSIFACNNLNGSPQADVYVDVYQTAHTTQDTYNYTGNDATYAIYRVFGGGNQADYAPENNSSTSLKVAHVYIHGCNNTIEEVYGGSNQADANSTRTIVDGGRFYYIFGGGNGIGGPANVGEDPLIHSTFSQIKGGHVAFCFGGSNSQGNCINIVQSFETDNVCDPLVIDNIYNGGNFADQVGEMVLNFSCETPENYKKAYGGCRLGTVYGNITVNVYGGIIGTLFGGCQGEGGQMGIDHPSNVKKYDDAHYPIGHPELIGTGGNITINLYGGTIGEVYGGCDINGNVEGRISINVYHIGNNCGLYIGNIYGASNQTDYAPVNLAEGIFTPKVSIIKAPTVGGDNTDLEQTYAGNVFGGGNLGTVTSNPKVVVGVSTNDKLVTIEGDVYGGGDQGNVDGAPEVIIVPHSHALTINAPESSSGNALRVTDILGNPVNSGASIDEYNDLKLEAMPSVYGQRFTGWTIGGEGAIVINSTLVSTTFVMGTGDAEITAGFGEANTHTLTVPNPLHGNVSVTDPQDHTVDLTQGISEGAELTLVATPAEGYTFAGWSVEGAGVITSLISPTTTFIVGAGDATITATFLPTHTLTINIVPANNSSVSVTVTDAQGNIINSGAAVREGAVLNLVATHAQGYNFAGWSCTGQGSSIGNPSSATTTFTMGTENATITATFTSVP